LPSGRVLLRIIVFGRQHDEARERAINHIGPLQCTPKMQRRRGAVNTNAGLVDILAVVLTIPVGVFRSKENPTSRGLKLGHVVQDVGDVAWAFATISSRGQEHPEFINLEQDRRLAVNGRQKPRPGSDLVAAQVRAEARCHEEFIHNLPAVVFAGPGIRHSNDIQV